MLCPKCDKKLTKIKIDTFSEMGQNDEETPKNKYFAITCPNCDTVISVVINPEWDKFPLSS